jgi:hypothetical protein
MAAAHALARLVPAHVARGPHSLASLDLIAAAIAALVPVHGPDAASGEPQIKRADVERATELLVAE